MRREPLAPRLRFLVFQWPVAALVIALCAALSPVRPAMESPVMSGCDGAVYANRRSCLGVAVVDGAGSRAGKLRTVAFNDAMVDTIAEAIEAQPSLAPFQLPGAAVYQFTLPGSDGRPSAMVTLWPSLRRVDAIGTGAAVVFTRIASVQLVDGVEVLFRRETGEYLVIAKGGRIIVRS